MANDARARSRAVRHMNSCRIFHNINSITYKYCTVTTVQSEWESFKVFNRLICCTRNATFKVFKVKYQSLSFF